MLAPLYFGYEAILMEIDPLMILADGSWMVGDVRMAIDEAALFRHPELITLLERRSAYGDIRRLRATGIDYRVLDPSGNIATIACGAGHCACLLDELIARGLKPYNFMDAGPAMLNGPPERLDDILQWLRTTTELRCILVAVGDGALDLAQFAQHLAAALERAEDFKTPVVARFTGAGAGAAGAILQQASSRVLLEPDFDLALDLVAAQVAGAPG
jgi:succinyl-CoA synthetase beta subunit